MPTAPRHPASLTKLMTLYMLFEALRDHRVTLDDPMPVSAHAASMEPVKLYLPPGTTLTVAAGNPRDGDALGQRRRRRRSASISAAPRIDSRR